MGASDGYVVGSTKVVDHGPATQRYNIVVVGDGYRSGELNDFHQDVDNFINALYATPPFDQLWCGINVYRVDVVSTDSGADDPSGCGGTGATANTYFDSSFCNSGARRLLLCDSALALNVAQTQVPQAHVVVVSVNSSVYGGGGGSVATFSQAPSAVEVAIHELGHTAFGLADEYDYYLGCGVDTDRDNYPGGEPAEPNVTINTNRNTVKWSALIQAATPVPTTQNADCSQCDSQANPVAAGTIGIFEGARYYHCDCHRPAYNCKMRALGQPFCAVCAGVITQTLQPFLTPQSITLTTPSISFTDIPEGIGGAGVTTYRAIVFEVVTCTPLTFRMVAGPTGGFGTPFGTVTLTQPARFTPTEQARLWLSYTSTTAGSVSNGAVTIRCDETGQEWVININANTVARPTSAVALVLDHSGSMSEDAGDGTIKVQKLREAANIFVNVMLDGDGLALVRFDDTSEILMPVTDVGPAIIGAGRTTAIGLINGPQLDPDGATSIGAGVQQGKSTIDAVIGSYDVRAMLVLTDGMENTPPMLSSVSGSITANTFAIGLGRPENISTGALNTLTQNNNGYLLITGTLTPDQAARLQKYFLQILAGITNANVILDPQGVLVYGAEHRIPFQVSEAEYGLDVILLTPAPSLVSFTLETPDGTVIDPGVAGMEPNVEFVPAQGVAYYRIGLPALPQIAGTWHAVLRMGRTPGRTTDRPWGDLTHVKEPEQGLRYNLVVHGYSNLSFRANLMQSSFEPGADMTVYATLKEYDVPVEGRATVWAEVTTPNNTTFNLGLTESPGGQFSATMKVTMPGLYTFRVRSQGTTYQGTLFTREQTLSGAVYRGGDSGSGDVGILVDWLREHQRHLCELLACLTKTQLQNEKLIEHLAHYGIDVSTLVRCLRRFCAHRVIEGTKPNSESDDFPCEPSSALSAENLTAFLSNDAVIAQLRTLIDRGA